MLSGTDIVKADAVAISAPSELGYYYVEVHYKDTANCAEKDIAFGIQIVKRQVEPIYEAQVEYTGSAQFPVVTVNSGTGNFLFKTLSVSPS